MRMLTKAGMIFLWLFLISPSIFAQAISIPDTLIGWNERWITSLNGSQATYSNWSKGGSSSVSATASSAFTLLNRKNRRGYGFRVNLQYGQAYINREGFRKTDDVFSIRNRFTQGVQSDRKLSVFVSSMFQTQFDKGYDYNVASTGADSLISDFASPVYFSENIGLAYNPTEHFTVELGIGLKQTLVANNRLTDNYGFEPGESFRSEGGISAGIDFQKEIFPNIFYTGHLESFTNLLNGLKKTDISWANEMTGEINEVVIAMLQFELRYDDDYSSRVQLKQVLSVGVSLNLYE